VPRDHGRVFFLSSERASGFHLHNANLVFGKAAQRHQRLMNVVRALQRAPHSNSIFGVERRDRSVIFDVQLLLRAGKVLALDDVRRFLPDGVHVTLFNQEGLESIVAAPDDCGLLLAFFHGVHGGKRLVLDGNRVYCLAKLVTVCMGQKQNRFFGMIHGFGGEAGLVVQDQGDAVFPRNVFGRYEYKIVPGKR
jgi:hypothetical protein